MPRGVNDYDAGQLQGRNVANANSLSIVSPGLITDGLVLHLDAGNYVSYPASGTTWFDLSNNRYNGTLTSGPTFSQTKGGAIVFDGVNDRVITPAVNLTYTDNISVEMFCRVVAYTQTPGGGLILVESTANAFAAPGGIAIICADDGGSFLGGNYPIDLTNAQAGFSFNIQAYNKTLVNDLNWHHWVAIFDSRQTSIESKLFIDGVEYARQFDTGYNMNNTNNFGNNIWNIGARNNGSFPINAEMSQFRIYNRALNPQEIQQNFNATRARFGI